ncbi:MAG: hypothetical protein JKX76_02065 [Colwellia sp.]|nr:hypothetical protein [Colwellia sp.]
MNDKIRKCFDGMINFSDNSITKENLKTLLDLSSYHGELQEISSYYMSQLNSITNITPLGKNGANNLLLEVYENIKKYQSGEVNKLQVKQGIITVDTGISNLENLQSDFPQSDGSSNKIYKQIIPRDSALVLKLISGQTFDEALHYTGVDPKYLISAMSYQLIKLGQIDPMLVIPNLELHIQKQVISQMDYFDFSVFDINMIAKHIDTLDFQGFNPLISLCFHGKFDLAIELLDYDFPSRGVDVNYISHNGFTAMAACCYILHSGVNIKTFGENIILKLIEKDGGNKSHITETVNIKFSFNDENNKYVRMTSDTTYLVLTGNSLFLAVSRSYNKIVETLLETGLNDLGMVHNRTTILLISVSNNNNTDIVDLILARGEHDKQEMIRSGISEQNTYNTALINYVYKGNPIIFYAESDYVFSKLLQTHEIDLGLISAEGTTILDQSIITNRKRYAELIILESERQKVVNGLISNPAIFDHVIDNKTPLIRAVKRDWATVSLSLIQSADSNPLFRRSKARRIVKSRNKNAMLRVRALLETIEGH